MAVVIYGSLVLTVNLSLVVILLSIETCRDGLDLLLSPEMK
jgi:hypothetical protein